MNLQTKYLISSLPRMLKVSITILAINLTLLGVSLTVFNVSLTMLSVCLTYICNTSITCICLYLYKELIAQTLQLYFISIYVQFMLIDQFSFDVESGVPTVLRFLGRELKLKKASSSVLDADFHELCERVSHLHSYTSLSET